ncbi:tubulin polymerization-promoting protein homolog [Manduca sexta]|uniref:tubulin polymerization-promoting protein homolog n=1 Tax=Manduca sexta TaxID=7130 RepID=UPI0011826D0D|nr:tubulin polymerization-promoting protein homolog [Manduca sexta]
MDEEAATLESQFCEFARFMDNKRDGSTITLYRSDYWMRQSKLIDDRKVTMIDTGILWWKFCKTELNFNEWHEFLTDFCEYRSLDQEFVETTMTNCGNPGASAVNIPQYREFFDTYQPKEKSIF